MSLRGQVYFFFHFFPYMSIICLLFSPKEAIHRCLDPVQLATSYCYISVWINRSYILQWLSLVLAYLDNSKYLSFWYLYVSIEFFCILFAYMLQLSFKFVYQYKYLNDWIVVFYYNKNALMLMPLF